MTDAPDYMEVTDEMACAAIAAATGTIHLDPVLGMTKALRAALAVSPLHKRVKELEAENERLRTSQPVTFPSGGKPGSRGNPLPTTDWPDENPPPHWWGFNANGKATLVYRSYEDYVND